MLFGTYQSGGATELALNCTDLRRGDSLELMNGTETVVSGSASVHFAAGPAPAGVINTSFYVQGCGNGTEWVIQGSNGPSTADNPGVPTSTINNFAATFQNLTGSDTVGNGPPYTDTGSAIWYRFYVKTFVAGDAPVVIVRRS
jgi:hypothetical protein